MFSNCSYATKAYQEFGDGFTDQEDFRHIVRMRSRSVISSHLAEVFFNHAKNHKLVKAKKKFRKPEKSLAAALSRHIESRVHRYDAVPLEVGTEQGARQLAQDCWHATVDRATLPIQEIVTSTQKAAYFSPGPSECSAPCVDLQLMRDCVQAGNWLPCSTAWLGAICKWSHKLVLKLPGHPGLYMALHHWQNSAALVLPLQQQVGNASVSKPMFDFVKHDSPMLVSITQLAEVKAVTVSFRSPRWCKQQLHCIPGHERLSMVQNEVEFKPVLEVAAKRAFWSLDKCWLLSLAGFLGIALPSGATLLEILMALISHILHCSHDETLQLLHQRLASCESKGRWHKDILEVEGCTDCLDKHDIEQFVGEQKAGKQRQQDSEELRCDYKKKVQQLHPMPKKKAEQNMWRSELIGAMPQRLPPIGTISHATAKQWVPPGGFIWRCLKSGAFACHFPPFPRTSYAWQKFGEQQSMLMCLRDLWRHFCDVKGIPIDACPLQGVFEG